MSKLRLTPFRHGVTKENTAPIPAKDWETALDAVMDKVGVAYRGWTCFTKSVPYRWLGYPCVMTLYASDKLMRGMGWGKVGTNRIDGRTYWTLKGDK